MNSPGLDNHQRQISINRRYSPTLYTFAMGCLAWSKSPWRAKNSALSRAGYQKGVAHTHIMPEPEETRTSLSGHSSACTTSCTAVVSSRRTLTSVALQKTCKPIEVPPLPPPACSPFFPAVGPDLPTWPQLQHFPLHFAKRLGRGCMAGINEQPGAVASRAGERGKDARRAKLLSFVHERTCYD